MAKEDMVPTATYKVWKNPSHPGEPVAYLGEYRPPKGRVFFTPEDFRELGFLPGDYTVLVPEDSPLIKFASKWQKVTVAG